MNKCFRYLCLFSAIAFAKDIHPQRHAEPAPAVVTTNITASQLPAGGAHPLTAADLDAYFDGFIPYAIGRGDIAGAEVVVVKDGQILFEKGYGVADVKNQTPVAPNRTLFRVGSISKLFTCTAVMQLVEQHKLDLDRDVNEYLDFRIPETWSNPITLRDLMTHTPGFEEVFKGLLVTNPKALRALGSALRDSIPKRIFPPGQTPAYSNYGMSLAGYIVERVSGEPFEQYVARHILLPLGMTHSTFAQPLPQPLATDMSSGYELASGDAKNFELTWMRPAGALSTTGDDIARFMIAHLNDGAYGDTRILAPASAQLMHSEVYQRSPPLPGVGIGFWREDTNGHVIVGHAGDTIYFHSALHLILDQHVGIYYAQNSAGKGFPGVRWPLFVGFMNRYFPAPALQPEPTLTSAAADGALVAGVYDSSRRSDSSFLRIVSQQTKVSLNQDGTISVSDIQGRNGQPLKWHEVKPFVWREVNDNGLLIAKLKDGAVQEIVSDEYLQTSTLTRSSILRSSLWNLPLLIATLGTLVLTALFWPTNAVVRWYYGQPFAIKGPASVLYRLTRIVALLDLLFLGGYVILLTYGASHPEVFNPPLDKWLLMLQIVGLLGVLGSVIPVYEGWDALRDGSRPWLSKAADVLIALAVLATVWFAFTLNLLTFHFKY